MRWLGIFWLLLVAAPAVKGFVPYFVNNAFFKWDLQNGSYHANLVNPQSRRIRYQIASDAYSAENRVAELEAVRASFDQWQSVSGTAIGFEEGPLAPAGGDIRFDNTNLVFWVKGTTLVRDGRDSISGLRGYTFTWFLPSSPQVIREADIVLNGTQYSWFTDFNNTVSASAFVESVALHEIGHLLGLDHAPAGAATMANGAPGIGTQAGLSKDDIAGIRFLYPAGGLNLGTIRGRVTMGGSGVYGALVIAEGLDGNLANATVTRTTGDFDLPGLAPGSYRVRVSPLDPNTSGTSQSLFRPNDVAAGYENAVTGFKATQNIQLTVNAGQSVTQNFTVSAGEPPFRITSVSKPMNFELVSLNRHAVVLPAGSANWYVAVCGPTLPASGVLSVTGDGITMGASVFRANHFSGLNSISASISVAANATPGMRSLVVTDGQNVAYANGYLEIPAAYPDFNFDGLNDYFQRRYFSRWTAAAAAPGADPDNDQFSNAYEERTGTVPTSGSSYSFLIERVTLNTQESIITFKSDIGKKYRVLSRFGFSPEYSWTSHGEVTATGATTEFRVPHSRLGPGKMRYFRLELVP